MKSLKNNHKIGTVLAVVGILTGLLILFLLAKIYMPTVEGKILDGRPDEAITVRIVFALLGWVGITGGALWVVVLYGFLNEQKWAWLWGTVAATIQILAGFFPMIPPASIGMPTPTIWVFLVAIVLWFGMLFIGGVAKKLITLAALMYVVYSWDKLIKDRTAELGIEKPTGWQKFKALLHDPLKFGLVGRWKCAAYSKAGNTG